MSKSDYLSIGSLAAEAGVHVQTLRYYEHEGLLTPSARTPGGQRRYADADRRRLHFIRHAREFGFTIDQVRELLELAADPDRSCAEIDAIARRHRDAVQRRIALLTELEQELDRMIRDCEGGRVTECRVLDVLGDHERCRSDHGRGPGGGRDA